MDPFINIHNLLSGVLDTDMLDEAVDGKIRCYGKEINYRMMIPVQPSEEQLDHFAKQVEPQLYDTWTAVLKSTSKEDRCWLIRQCLSNTSFYGISTDEFQDLFSDVIPDLIQRIGAIANAFEVPFTNVVPLIDPCNETEPFGMPVGVIPLLLYDHPSSSFLDCRKHFPSFVGPYPDGWEIVRKQLDVCEKLVQKWHTWCLAGLETTHEMENAIESLKLRGISTHVNLSRHAPDVTDNTVQNYVNAMRSNSFSEYVKQKQWRAERTEKRHVARMYSGEDIRSIIATETNETCSDDEDVHRYKMCQRAHCSNPTRSKKTGLCEKHYRMQRANILPPCKMCFKETKHIRCGLCRSCKRLYC